MCVHGRLWYKEFHVVTSCSTDQGGDQEWRRWNANQAIHNSVEHCSLGPSSPFLKGVPTKLVEHCCNAACHDVAHGDATRKRNVILCYFNVKNVDYR